MKKDQSMKEIEQLLDMAPEVKDMRTKEEVFARLKKDGVFEDSIKVERSAESIASQHADPVLKQQKGSRLATVAVAAVGFIIFGGIGGYLLSQNNNSMDKALNGADMATMQDQPELDSAGERSINPFEIEGTELVSFISNSSLVWEEDLTSVKQLRLGLVTEQLDVVPVTVLIDNSRILHDFNSDSSTYLNYYNRYATEIDEEALGFVPYHPLEGKLQEENGEGELTHILNINHLYDVGSASEILYQQVLNETFSPAFLKASILSEDGSPAEFAHMGPIGGLVLEHKWKRPYFVTDIAGNRYIAPVEGLVIDDVEQALEELTKTPQYPNFESPILEEATYKTSFDGDIVTVSFTEALDLSKYEPSEIATMFDAIIMTAASYGTRVQFENVINADGNQYPLGEPIKKPIGANKIILSTN